MVWDAEWVDRRTWSGWRTWWQRIQWPSSLGGWDTTTPWPKSEWHWVRTTGGRLRQSLNWLCLASRIDAPLALQQTPRRLKLEYSIVIWNKCGIDGKMTFYASQKVRLLRLWNNWRLNLFFCIYFLFILVYTHLNYVPISHLIYRHCSPLLHFLCWTNGNICYLFRIVLWF